MASWSAFLLKQGLVFIFNGRMHQPLVGILYCFGHLLSHIIGTLHKLLFQGIASPGGVSGSTAQFQESLLFSPSHGQDPVTRTLLQGLAELKIVPVLFRLLFLAFHHF